MSKIDWTPGDALGLRLPAHAEALAEGGADYLTKAFRAMGALAHDNRVARITEMRDCAGGGTGSKLFLSVVYEKPAPHLREKLFVKFSRDFSDELRDRSRHMMEAEVRFAALSRAPGFPIKVAECVYADFHHESGTGVLITERIPYGENGIAPHRAKCLDYDLADPLEHYQAIVRALARLSGAHKAGKLAAAYERYFPFDAEALIAKDRIRYDADQVARRIARIGEFMHQHAQLFPENIRDPSFLAQMTEQAPLILANESAIRAHLFGDPDFIALCHWNANIDNAWFWRDENSILQCGLLDWGAVSQMNLAQALYGALSGAEPWLWDEHLDDLLALFAEEFAGAGGPSLDVDALKLNVQLVTATMGLAYILDAPAIMRSKMPNIGKAKGPRDPILRENEDARVWLHMLTMFLNQWRTQDFGAAAARVAR